MWSYPCCPPRAASFEADLPGEKTNIDRNDMSSFLFHNRVQVCPSIATDGRTICSGTQKLNRANWSKGQHQRQVEHSFLSGGDRRRQRQQMPVDMDNWRDVVIDTLNEMACASALRRFFLSS